MGLIERHRRNTIEGSDQIPQFQKFVLLLCLLLLSFSNELHAKTEKDSSEWLLIYYIPYDNNLSEYADSIINQLEGAKNLKNVNVVIQLDQSDSLGMQRISFASGRAMNQRISVEESYDKSTLMDFLSWTNDNFSFNKCALFFLDHGGRPDEIGQDLYPDSTFLKTTSIRKSVQAFNQKNKDLIDLIYLQVCTKASIETLYEFHDLCEFTLASQDVLGAPNFYYEKTLQELNQSPDIKGNQLASFIAKNDAPEMFATLTCINNSAFDAVKLAFRKYSAEVHLRTDLAFNAMPTYFDYGSDRYWDLNAFLNEVNSKSTREMAARDSLIEQINDHLIDHIYISEKASNVKGSGISIAALSKARIYHFRKMQFYRDFKIKKLNLN